MPQAVSEVVAHGELCASAAKRQSLAESAAPNERGHASRRNVAWDVQVGKLVMQARLQDLEPLQQDRKRARHKSTPFSKRQVGGSFAGDTPTPGALCLCATQLKCMELDMPGTCPISKASAGCMELAQSVPGAPNTSIQTLRLLLVHHHDARSLKQELGACRHPREAGARLQLRSQQP